jgi:hypothetical protein
LDDSGLSDPELALGMKIDIKDPPRKFEVGHPPSAELSDCGSISLDHDEQVTFLTDSGKEYDVARKDWGFYATPSLNGRLRDFGLRAVLVRSQVTGRYFVWLVEDGKELLFEQYRLQEKCDVICWLDTTEACDAVRQAVS